MAIGTVTVVRAPEPVRPLRVVTADVVPTSGANYTAGGDTITAASVGLMQILGGVANVKTSAATVGPGSACVIPQADGSALLKCNVAAGNADNSSNANLSSSAVRVTLLGY